MRIQSLAELEWKPSSKNRTCKVLEAEKSKGGQFASAAVNLGDHIEKWDAQVMEHLLLHS